MNMLNRRGASQQWNARAQSNQHVGVPVVLAANAYALHHRTQQARDSLLARNHLPFQSKLNGTGRSEGTAPADGATHAALC